MEYPCRITLAPHFSSLWRTFFSASAVMRRQATDRPVAGLTCGADLLRQRQPGGSRERFPRSSGASQRYDASMIPASMANEPTSDEAKELYAHFGLAFYCSSVLEHGVANALLVLDLLDGRGGAKTRSQWEALVDKHFDDSFAKTLGSLMRQLARHRDSLPDLATMSADLERCLAERNFLAHHFWREFAEDWFTSSGRVAMARRLETARDLFSETDAKLEAVVRPIASRHGITKEVLDREMEQLRREAGTTKKEAPQA